MRRNPAFFVIAFLAAFLLVSNGCYAQAFEHSLHFFQIRYGDSMGEPLPAGKVEFTIGPNAYDGLLQYAYVSFMTITPQENVSRGDAPGYVVSLDPSEIDTVYSQKGYWRGNVYRVDKNELQIADIQKIHKELNPSDPALYFGAELDASEKPAKPAGLTDADYQNGKTIVVPARYNNDVPFQRRFFFNLNAEAVREYMILYALKQAGSKNIFVDGAFVSNCQICVNCGFYSGGECPKGELGESKELHYISNESASSQIITYTSQINGILNKIKGSRQIILNGFSLSQSHPSTAEVLRWLLDHGSTNFDGIMLENGFWGDDQFYATDFSANGGHGNNCIEPWKYQGLGYRDHICTDIEYYRKYILELKNTNKKFLFVAGSDVEGHPDYLKFAIGNPLIEDIWLWFHLIASQNTYFYITQTTQEPMLNYPVYDSPLGVPLEEEGPSKDGNTWSREYERGTVVFDTTKGCISEIKFIEKEICDGKDNDGDTLIDEDNVCCNNGQCDAGETVTTCPQDCKCGNTLCDAGETFETCPEDCQECVDNEKLVGDYIPKWKRGEITMLVLMQKIAARNAGTGCPQ